MKTNITTENYEAYLLDYMEGNLGPDETALPSCVGMKFP